jgi:hypothetical protein
VKAGLRAVRANDGGGLCRRYFVGGVVASIARLWPRCSRKTLDLDLSVRTMASLQVSLYLLEHRLRTHDA